MYHFADCRVVTWNGHTPLFKRKICVPTPPDGCRGCHTPPLKQEDTCTYATGWRVAWISSVLFGLAAHKWLQLFYAVLLYPLCLTDAAALRPRTRFRQDLQLEHVHNPIQVEHHREPPPADAEYISLAAEPDHADGPQPTTTKAEDGIFNTHVYCFVYLACQPKQQAQPTATPAEDGIFDNHVYCFVYLAGSGPWQRVPQKCLNTHRVNIDTPFPETCEHPPCKHRYAIPRNV